MSGRQAADAARGRIDWKYLLALELDDPGFDHSVLCEFRGRLLQRGAAERLLARVLEAAREAGLLSRRGRQRTDSAHVLAAIRVLNRLELVAETLRAALNALAAAAPEWLRAVAPADWHERHDRRVEGARLPEAAAKRDTYALQVGVGGYALLDVLDRPDTPAALPALPTVAVLRRADPAIMARARQTRGIIFWGDETGLRLDAVRGRGYAPRGRTPVVRVCRRRAYLSLIPAVANRGELRWMMVEGAVNAPTLVRFLQRLIREAHRKGFLIGDRLRGHRARLVRDWLAEHSSEIEVHCLPSYSPDLTPDQGVNADLTQAVPRQPPARSDQPHAPPVQATEVDPLDLPPPAVPLRRIVKTMRAASIAGRAAQRMREATGRQAYTIEGFLRQIAKQDRDIPAGALAVVDEASMPDLPTTDMIFRAGPDTARLRLVSDPAQLPPIGFGLIFHVAASGAVPQVTLTRVHRQAESTGIPAVALAIQEGNLPALPIFQENASPGVSVLPCGPDQLSAFLVDTVASLGGPDECQILSPLRQGTSGVEGVNNHFLDLCAPGRRLVPGRILAEGEPVVWMVTDWGHGLMNGSLGRIVEVSPESTVSADFKGIRHEFGGAAELEPMQLAHGITMHKAQGSQFRRVVIPVFGSRALDRTLIYTAVTRAMEQVVFVRDLAALRKAVAAPPRPDERLVGFSL